jgi:lipopolysaccharide exporter
VELLGKVRNIQNKFVRNVVTLVSAGSLSQAITLLAAPLLGHLYSPSEFGTFALYISISTIIGSVASWRYSQAIMLPAENAEAKILAYLSLSIVLVMSCIAALALLTCGSQFISLFDISGDAKWIYFIPFGVFLLGINDILNVINARMTAFKRIAVSNVGNAITHNTIKVTCGFIGSSFGLILGQIVGQIVANLILMKGYLVSFATGTKEEGLLEQMLVVSRRYSKFPKYQVIATFLNRAAVQMPPLVLAVFFTHADVGKYYFSVRLLGIPIIVVGRAVGNVFFQKASELKNEEGDYRSVVKRTFVAMLLIALIPMVVLGVSAPHLFSFVFGERWYDAGIYAQILAPYYMLMFAVSPLTDSLIVSEKQEFNMLMQILNVVLVGSGLIVGGMTGDIKITLALFCVAGCIRYIVEYLLCLKFSKCEVLLGGEGV